MARFCPLFSGSSGNCTYIGSRAGGILVDAGVGVRAILGALAAQGVDPAQIKGIFVTHEHTDHIRSLAALARRLDAPVIASPGTARALQNGAAPPARLTVFDASVLAFLDMQVTRFSLPHDAAEPTGYRFDLPDGRKIAVCTDLGVMTEDVLQMLTGCDLVLLESNHDLMMLQNSSYPYPLKKRILSDTGHLSNTHCSAVLPRLVHAGTTRLVLGHLSRENNRPALARSAACACLLDAGMKEDEDYLLRVAPARGGRMLAL